MLGTEFVDNIPDKYSFINIDLDTVDIRNYAEVEKVFKDYNPNFIFNFAAITDVDYCEDHYREAFDTNKVGVQNIAICCKKYESTLIFISTGAVFSGEKDKPYIEADERSPINIYGESKKEAEDIVLKMLKKYYIIRCGWLFGGYGKDKKFVGAIVNKLLEEREIYVVNDKYGSPTYTKDFSKGLLKIIEYKDYGIYHLVNNGCCSRYEIAQEIKKILGSNCKITSINSKNFKLRAKRPNMEALQNYNLNKKGYFKMRNWQIALTEYLNSFKIKD